MIGLDGLPLTIPKTGVGHYTYELANALARLRPENEFELVYPSTSGNIAGLDGDPDPLPTNLRLKRVEVGVIDRHWWSTGLPRYVRRTKFELFHGTNYDIPLWKSCPTVLTIHDLSTLLLPETHTRRSVSRARRRLPLMARLTNAVITPTESVKSEVCSHLHVTPDKVFAVPEAAREMFFVNEQDGAVAKELGIGPNFLLAVGTLEPRKNLAVLVQAFAQISSQLRDDKLQLVIAGGKGWLSEKLFEAIKKSPAAGAIILTDYLNDTQLRALYTSCRAFVYPSVYEGFGLPPLEAMACGAPVIASRIPAIVETTGDAALLFDPKSVEELGHAIQQVLTDGITRGRLSTSGRERARQFSWENTARLTWEVYEEACERFSKSKSSR